MEDSRETKQKLIESAKVEFMEKGYMKASLRTICKNAGVTTGAMYFFFNDKNDLFAGVVGGPLTELRTVIESHMLAEIKEMDHYTPGQQYDMQEDMKAATDVVKTLFKYKDDYELLITRSQGSSFENIIDDMADMLNSHYRDMFWTMKGYKSAKQMTKEDKFIVHWMSHDQIDIFIHLMTHCENEKEAGKMMKNMFNYMVGGWLATIRKDIIK